MRHAHFDEDTFPVFNPAFVARVHRRRRIAARKQEPATEEGIKREDEIRRGLARGLSYASTVKQIIAYVAAQHGFTYDEVISPLRSREMVACRCEAIQEVKRRKPEMGISAIGREFQRNHATIFHALKKGEQVQLAEIAA